jgi:competence protein ComEC
MLKWLPYPMIRITIFFTGGVLLGIYFPTIISFKLIVGLLIFFLSGFFVLKFYSEENRFPTALGFLGLSAVFLLGLVRVFLFTDSRDENHISKIKNEIQAYEAIIKSVPEEKEKSWKMEIEITSAKTMRWQPAKGKLLLYVSKKNFRATSFHYGDKILVKGNPEEIKSPANPGEFDFRRFFSFKNISHQQFVQWEDVRFISSAGWKGFIHYSHLARSWAMKKLKDHVQGDDERAIVIALVLGVTDGIDNDLQNAYAASGAMHVLAVSGMHVGIIYAIILFLFKPLNKYRWSKWIVALISLTLLWAFAFVTGLSPSVLRAVTMFSFIALARPFGKQTNIYNTLAASVLVLLIYNPYLIMSVGFQLSYLAVLGIVYLQRPIYNLWEIENRAGDWVWQMACVSIAAQAATFALGLLYFHQFPSYFLISNLLVVPLSTIVLVLGIFLLMVSFFSPLAFFTAMILEWLVKVLNRIVFKTEALPFSLINEIHISVFQCWLLMAILISLTFVFQFRSIKWLYASFGLTLVFVIFQWNHFFHEVNQKQMIVYHITNHQAVERIDRGRSFFISDSLLQHEPDQIRLHIRPNRLTHGVSRIQSMHPFGLEAKGIIYFRWDNKTIGWIKDRNAAFPTHGSVDCLIVSNNSLSKRSLAMVKPKSIIFDGSNSLRYVKAWEQESLQRNMGIYWTKEKGAYIF